MKVLVTGSEGYIGAVLVSLLQDAGHEVVGLDTCYFSNRRFIGDIPRYKLLKSDVRDVGMSQLKEFNAICHLAALSNDPAGELRTGITEDINYKGTVSLANKAKRAGVKRFIFSGSCSIYGAGDTSGFLTEEAGFNPVTSYGWSKVWAERDLSKLADESFSPVYLRNATAFGMSPKLRLDLVVNNLVAWAYTTKRIAMSSDGTPWRPIVHVRDICLAFKCALEAPISAIHNQAFNIGRTDANYQIKQIAEAVGTLIADAEITFGKNVGEDLDRRTYRVSFEKAKNNLPGFTPQWSLLDGIKEAYECYEEFGLKEEHLHGDQFITLNRYKNLLDKKEIGKDFRWVVSKNEIM